MGNPPAPEGYCGASRCCTQCEAIAVGALYPACRWFAKPQELAGMTNWLPALPVACGMAPHDHFDLPLSVAPGDIDTTQST